MNILKRLVLVKHQQITERAQSVNTSVHECTWVCVSEHVSMNWLYYEDVIIEDVPVNT